MDRAISSLRQDARGSTLVVMACAAMAVIGAVGVAVDVGRSQMVAAKLQSAVDAAGLAAGATLSSSDLSAVARKYVELNFSQGTLGAELGTVTATLSDDQRTLNVTADATLPTTITHLFGRNEVTVNAATEITRSSKGLELAMVLDTTGSMAGSKLTALKAAAHDLVAILFGDDETAENLWVGLVPFSQSVNIGTAHSGWLNQAYMNGLLWSPLSWGGCVEARWSSGRDVTDDPPYDLADPTAATPAAPYERLRAYYVPVANWGSSGVSSSDASVCSNSSSCTCSNYGPCNVWTQLSGNQTYRVTCSGSGSHRSCTKTTRTYTFGATNGPNAYCPSAVTPLTNTRSTIDSGIDALVARGNTHINFGAVWGWRLISPRWRDYWGGAMDTNRLPLNYNAPLMSKAVILMTDGVNTMGSYSAYPNSSGVTEEDLDTKTTQVCNAMKANGILVYTILFQESDTGVKTLLRNCATTPDFFFDSPTEEALQTAFQTIGDSLANLRISR